MNSARKILLAAAAVSLAVLLATPAAAQYYIATLEGAQEVPPRETPATGLGCFQATYDEATGGYFLDYEISFVGLLAAETGAHIHGPAGVGVNAGVIIPLPAGSPKVGSTPLTATQYGWLISGLLYVNIHSVTYPGGEIRGQILAAPGPCTVPVRDTTWGAVKALYR